MKGGWMLIDGGSTQNAGVGGADRLCAAVAKSGSSGKAMPGIAGSSGRLMVGTGGLGASSTETRGMFAIECSILDRSERLPAFEASDSRLPEDVAFTSSKTISFGLQSCLKLTIGRPGLSLTTVGRGNFGL